MSRPSLGAARLRALLEAHGVRPDKALGQNFVIDPNTIRKIVATAEVTRAHRILEVGPGAGSLTLELASAADSVVAVEVDRGLLPVLGETLAAFPNVEVIHGDAMRMDLGALGAERLVANLPYSIAASLVVKVLEDAPGIEELTVMTQKEVGRRLAAAPGSKAYGLASVLVAFHAAARVAMSVSRNAFYPVPEVDSVVVRIVRRPRAPEVDPARFAQVARAAFSQRRKTLRNSLARAAGSVREAERALAEAGVDTGARAEELGVGAFVALARAVGRAR